MLRVGILGSGTMGRIHASSYAEIEGVKVVAIADNLREKNDALISKYEARWSNSPDEIIKDSNIDIIDICLPTPLHKEYVVKSIKAGKHTFCEKPIARSLTDGEEIVKIVNKSKSKFMVGHVVRFFPDFLAVKQIIDGGKIGKVGIARSARFGHFPHGWLNWYGNLEMSGGVILDLIIHDFDFMNWFFGKPKRVFAQGLFKSGMKDFDYALVVIRYHNGVISHVEGSWAEPSGFGIKTEISGERGLLEMAPFSDTPLTVNIKSNDGKSSSVALPETPLLESPYTTELRHFVDCVIHDKKPAITAQDALNALKVALAALESIDTGKPVDIK